MRIFTSLKRKGGTEVPMGDEVYDFQPEPTEGVAEEKWPHVAVVENEAHIERFLAIEGFTRDPREVVAEQSQAEADRLELADLRQLKADLLEILTAPDANGPEFVLARISEWLGLQALKALDDTDPVNEAADGIVADVSDLEPEAIEGAASGEGGVGDVSSADAADAAGKRQVFLGHVLAKIADGSLTKPEASELYRELTGEEPKAMWTKAGIVAELKAIAERG